MDDSIKGWVKYSFITLLVIALILSFFILKPLLAAVVWAIILAYVFRPITVKLQSVLKHKELSVILTLLIILLIIIIPLSFVISGLILEVPKLSNLVSTFEIEELTPKLAPILDIFGTDTNKLFQTIGSGLISLVSSLIVSLPMQLLGLGVMLFTLFFLLRDGETIIESAKKHIPLKKLHVDKLFQHFQDVTKALVYGQVLAGFVQGALGTIGFLIFGIPNAFFWGTIMTILAMIPYLGPAFIWAPAAIILALQGDYWNAAGLFIYGVLLISTSDNLIRSWFVSKKINIHPITVLLGVIGGIMFMGMIGIIIGPFILSATLILIEILLENET